jgi:hypothetical protein
MTHHTGRTRYNTAPLLRHHPDTWPLSPPCFDHLSWQNTPAAHALIRADSPQYRSQCPKFHSASLCPLEESFGSLPDISVLAIYVENITRRASTSGGVGSDIGESPASDREVLRTREHSAARPHYET